MTNTANNGTARTVATLLAVRNGFRGYEGGLSLSARDWKRLIKAGLVGSSVDGYRLTAAGNAKLDRALSEKGAR